MEIYCYLDIPTDRVSYRFMVKPQETRHIWMQNHQAVISPPWSIHYGSGTSKLYIHMGYGRSAFSLKRYGCS